jgi:hypothetical protein
VVVDDSIFAGLYVGTPGGKDAMTLSPHMLVRGDYPGRVSAIGAGSYSLYNLTHTFFASADALADEIAAMCDGTITNEILMQIGTVDWATPAWWASVAAFRAALASLLTKIRARTSAYVWLQTVGIRTDAPSSVGSSTLAQWRTAQAGALTDSGIANASAIDGSTLYAGGDLYADGVHLTTAGAANYKAALKAAIGY